MAGQSALPAGTGWVAGSPALQAQALRLRVPGRLSRLFRLNSVWQRQKSSLGFSLSFEFWFCHFISPVKFLKHLETQLPGLYPGNGICLAGLWRRLGLGIKRTLCGGLSKLKKRAAKNNAFFPRATAIVFASSAFRVMAVKTASPSFLADIYRGGDPAAGWPCSP